MVDVKIVKALPKHVSYLSYKLRKADVSELKKTIGCGSYEGLKLSYEASDPCYTVLIDGYAEAMFGVAPKGVMSGTGIIWLLMSDEPVRYRKEFKFVAAKIFENLKTGFTKLENWVDIENIIAIKWLKELGFIFDEKPKPYGVSRELFYHFEWRRG